MHHKFMGHNYYLVDVIIFKINIVRTGFDLNPEQEWTQVKNVRTINLQRVGEKTSLNLRKRYWSIVLKGKGCTCTNPESILGHALVVRSRVQNSFLLLLYFFHLFLIFLLFYPFSCYILRFLHQFLHPSVSQVFRVSLSPFAPSLEPSTLSCKSAGSLLRHQLHINAAREVARQHLMRR